MVRNFSGSLAILGYHFNPSTITFMNEAQIQNYNEQIQALEAQITGDMFADMEIRDKIHNLKMERDGVKPTDSSIDCVGCGS